jgi:uncharacterized protein (TIGR00251 family)
MTVPPYLSERDGSLWLSVKAKPRAKNEELAGIVGNELKVKVTAPPVDSAANEALVGFLAGKLGCPRRGVTLVRGQTSPHKVFRIDGVRLADAIARLAS